MQNKNYIINLLNLESSKFINYSVNELKKIYKINSEAKNVNSLIVKNILNFDDLDFQINNFFKKNFLLKTVHLNKNNKIKEHMSFLSINFYDILNNSWNNSAVYNYFSKYTIVLNIFETKDKESIYSGIKYFKLSIDELDQIFQVWINVKNLISDNKYSLGGKHGFSVTNFPKPKDNNIAHIRPKDRDSSHGSIKLPNGDFIINYCFWLNKKFIESKIKNGDTNE